MPFNNATNARRPLSLGDERILTLAGFIQSEPGQTFEDTPRGQALKAALDVFCVNGGVSEESIFRFIKNWLAQNP